MKRYGYLIKYTDVDADSFGSREENKVIEWFATREERNAAKKAFCDKTHFDWGYREISFADDIDNLN